MSPLIVGLTKTLALELRNEGLPIYCNVVCSTMVKTPMCETPRYVEFINKAKGHDFADWREMYADGERPGGLKFLDPEDITEVALWLAESNAATKFTGREIVVDCGAML